MVYSVKTYGLFQATASDPVYDLANPVDNKICIKCPSNLIPVLSTIFEEIHGTINSTSYENLYQRYTKV